MDNAAPIVENQSIISLLEADDARVGALFERYAAADEAQGPAVIADRLAGRICETLSIQRLAEEEVLYPALRAADDKLVFAFQLAGLGISMRIGEVRDPGQARAQRRLSASRLAELVRRNLVERSQILFPFVRGRMSATQLVWLGDDYQQRKSRLWTNASGSTARRALPRKDPAIPVWQRAARTIDEARAR